MHVVVDIHLTADEYLKWYRGDASSVVAYSRDGRRIRFPVSSLHPYITHEGVRGSFAVHFNEHNKLVKVEKLG